MKRLIAIICVYTAIIFAICIGASVLYRPVPPLNAGDEAFFRCIRGLSYFLRFLPAVLLSGFSVACSALWHRKTENSKKRFSQAMYTRFRYVILDSLVMVFILTLSHEIFLPLVQKREAELTAAPEELADAKATAKTLLAQEEPDLAYQYALRALSIAKNDAEANQLVIDAKDAVDVAHDRARHEEDSRKQYHSVDEVQRPLYTHDHAFSIAELMQNARESAAREDWFEAHYWAALAVAGCSGSDTNFQEANELANEAWGKLKNPAGFGNEEAFDFYTRKMAAYQALSSGTTSDNLTAYYAFLLLQQEPGHEKDPDIVHFLELARESIENDYFFIDETELLTQLENSHNIYFSLESPVDNSQHVFFIKGAMDTKEDGQSVRYLDNLTIVTYDQDGKFLSSLHAPIAKVIAYPLADLNEHTARALGVEPSWRSVPFLMLQAVDRETKGVIVAPTYSRKETGLDPQILAQTGFSYSKNQPAEPTAGDISEEESAVLIQRRTLLLPMPYSDFIAINDASRGPDKMDLLTLNSFMNRITNYGFSYEVFAKSLIGRTMYPLFLLVLFVVAAAMGWNYRIEGHKQRFKFRWLFLVPVYGAVMYLILEITTYFYEMLNYVLVGAFGRGALLVAFIVYTLCFLLVSINFLARHE